MAGRGRVVLLVGSVVAVVVLAVATSVGARWLATFGGLATADRGLLVLAVLLQLLSLDAFARMQRATLRAAGAEVPVGVLRRIVLRSNAMAVTLPVGGSAVGTNHTLRSLREEGVPERSAATSSILSWLFVGAGVVAVVLPAVAVRASGAARTSTVAAAAFGLIVPVLVVSLAHSPRAVAALRRRLRVAAPSIGADDEAADPVAEGPASWRRRIVEALDALGSVHVDRRLVLAATALAVLSRVADAGSLAAAVGAFRGGAPGAGLLVGYGVGLGATFVSLTPAGFGTVEVSLASALIAAGTAGEGAWSGAIVYRVIAVVVVAGLGWLGLAARRRRGLRPTTPIDPTASTGHLDVAEAPVRSRRRCRHHAEVRAHAATGPVAGTSTGPKVPTSRSFDPELAEPAAACARLRG